MKVILDPNVLVSAVIAQGVSADLLDRWLTDRPFQLVVCPTLIAELRDVLARPKFYRWITTEDAAAFVDLLEHEAEPWVDPIEVPPATEAPRTTISSPYTGAAKPICWSPATPTSSAWKPTTSPS